MNVDQRSFNVLSFCAGAGGLDLGVQLACPIARTIGYVEIEAYACEVLATRMEEGTLDAAPIWTDLRTFRGRKWRGLVDLLIGGYPCQPFSVAGKQLGAADPRHLWPVIRRNIRIIRPQLCFFENVSNHLQLGFDQVARELQAMDYVVAAGLFTAEEIGAPHKRERLFIMAYSRSAERAWRGTGRTQPAGLSHIAERSSAVAHTNRTEPRSECGLQPARAGAIGSAGEAVAHTGCLPEGRAAERSEAEGGRALDQSSGSGARVAGTSGELANAEGFNRELQLQQRRSDEAVSELGRPSEEVANAGGSGLPLTERSEPLGSGHGEEALGSALQLCGPVFPPRPDDTAGWQFVLAHWPALAPAVERPVRGMADGMAARVDRLRLCGNGVVPQAAALAFVTLYRDLMASMAHEQEEAA